MIDYIHIYIHVYTDTYMKLFTKDKVQSNSYIKQFREICQYLKISFDLNYQDL